MPVSANVEVQEPAVRDFKPLPPDTYQVQIEDISDEMNKKYKSEEEEVQLKFTCIVIEKGDYYGRKIWVRATPKVSGGKKPSKLYTILSTVTGRKPTDEEMAEPKAYFTPEFLNSLIGLQLRLVLTVTLKTDGSGEERNKVEAYLPVKEKLPSFQPPSKEAGA